VFTDDDPNLGNLGVGDLACRFETPGVSPNAHLEVVWYFDGVKMELRPVKPTDAGAALLYRKYPTAGTYKVQLVLDGTLLNEVSFTYQKGPG
jgi:hypothetical protein